MRAKLTDMSKAWGHKVRKLTDEEIQKQIEAGRNWYKWREENNYHEDNRTEEQLIHVERKCRISSKCDNECTQLLTYHYVTGRAGRTSFAEKPICEHHAEKYQVDGQ